MTDDYPETKEEFDKLKLDLTIPKTLNFVKGEGDPGIDHTACIMSASAFMIHKAMGTEEDFIVTDHLTCVDPSIQDLCIRVNDQYTSDGLRKSWALKYIPKILGTKFVTKEIAEKRDEMLGLIPEEKACTIKKLTQVLEEMIALGEPVVLHTVEEEAQEVEQVVCREYE
jgi:hypothetical protein